jgi:hypothetical protein
MGFKYEISLKKYKEEDTTICLIFYHNSDFFRFGILNLNNNIYELNDLQVIVFIENSINCQKYLNEHCTKSNALMRQNNNKFVILKLNAKTKLFVISYLFMT